MLGTTTRILVAIIATLLIVGGLGLLSIGGGNAVVSMRFDSSEMATTMTEIVAYGTAVVVEADGSAPQSTE